MRRVREKGEKEGENMNEKMRIMEKSVCVTYEI